MKAVLRMMGACLLITACAAGAPEASMATPAPTESAQVPSADEPTSAISLEPASPTDTPAPAGTAAAPNAAAPTDAAAPTADALTPPPPNATEATRESSTPAPVCLVGTWRAANLIELVRSVFTRQGQPVPADLHVAGDLTIVFGAGGDVVYTYDRVEVQGTIDLGGTEIPVAIAVHGPGIAGYDIVDGGSIAFSDANLDGLEVTMTISGQPAAAGAVTGIFALVSAAEETAEFACGGDAAQIRFPERADAPLMLERMR